MDLANQRGNDFFESLSCLSKVDPWTNESAISKFFVWPLPEKMPGTHALRLFPAGDDPAKGAYTDCARLFEKSGLERTDRLPVIAICEICQQTSADVG